MRFIMILREYLFRKNMTRKSFAEMLHITEHYAGRIVNQKVDCSKKIALKIEELTNGLVTAEEMLLPEKYIDKRLTI